ncbi:hypothetical protein FNW02_37005 [Komarekiella sp. 'clone 1']|uniref:Uncharacterized protein n=1 Tax=Komarekiella delphini-convector SJRDD-AB1 TaxID=2593771 RepID=A0AA40VVP7_9NOST|nr:hypothetical protein [Komarekiella delphini-convector]MBD6621151.1 hypothetical protein [Komarekiella delphini-convector SJRDD-AB1]
MDTLKDFNHFDEREYLVIQTYPRDLRLRITKRSFDYKSAKICESIENLAHDYTFFALRISHDSKLWTVDFEGNPESLSLEQDWKIAEKYFQPCCANVECGLNVCQCSYPYFSTIRTDISSDGEYNSHLRLETCLVDDNSRQIDHCPNCNCALIVEFDEDEDEDELNDEESTPIACIGCQNYHGQYYGGNMLVCGIHARGWDGENCPDYQQ